MPIKVGFFGHSEMLQEFKEFAPRVANIEMVEITKANLRGTMDLDYAIIRCTTSVKPQMEGFVRRNPHINFLDNLDRFFSPLGKKESSIARMHDGTGARTFLTVDETTVFPIVAKPIMGRKEQGILYLNNYAEYKRAEREIDLPSYIFQSKLNIDTEYRALVLHINGVFKAFIRRKVRAAGVSQKPLKVSQSNVNKITAFIQRTRSNKVGIIGYDIAILQDGSIVYIEENRSPMFEITEKRFDTSMPREILQIIADSHR